MHRIGRCRSPLTPCLPVPKTQAGLILIKYCNHWRARQDFELVTSAFGGQFPKFAMSCGGLLIGEKCRVYDKIRLNIFTAA